jgi:hypothetical protein
MSQIVVAAAGGGVVAEKCAKLSDGDPLRCEVHTEERRVGVHSTPIP